MTLVELQELKHANFEGRTTDEELKVAEKQFARESSYAFHEMWKVVAAYYYTYCEGCDTIVFNKNGMKIVQDILYHDNYTRCIVSQ